MKYPVLKETPANEANEEEKEPKKNTSKTPYTGNFTWVNKSSANVRRRTKEETLSIRSHVQRRFVPWHKQNRIKPTRSATLLTSPTIGNPNHVQTENWDTPNPPSKLHRPPDTVIPGPDFQASDTGDVKHVSPTDPQPSQSLVIVLENQPEQQHRRIKHPLRDRQPSIKQEEDANKPTLGFGTLAQLRCLPCPVANGSWDPFESTAVHIDARSHESISVLGRFIMNTIWPSLRTRESKTRACNAWAMDCRGVLHDETYLHGLLASAFVITSRLVSSDSPISRQLRAQSYMHQAECLKRIRQSLNGKKVDEKLVHAIWSAISCCMLAGDLQTSRIHLAGLKKVIDQLGGVHVLPMLLQRKILCWDAGAAGALYAVPVFSPTDWKPSSLQSLFVSIEDFDILHRLRASIDQSKSQRLHETITETLRPHFVLHREAITVATFADQLELNSETQVVMDRWGYAWKGNLEVSNLIAFNEMTADLQLCKDDVETEYRIYLELCLSLSVRFIYRFISRQNLENAGCLSYEILRSHLEHLIRSYFSLIDNSTREAILWMLFVGATAEEVINRSMPADQAHLWFTSTFLDVVVDLNKQSLPDLQVTLSDFVYDPSHFEHILLALLHRLDKDQSHDSRSIEDARASMLPFEFALRNSHLDTLGGRTLKSPLTTKALHPVFHL